MERLSACFLSVTTFSERRERNRLLLWGSKERTRELKKDSVEGRILQARTSQPFKTFLWIFFCYSCRLPKLEPPFFVVVLASFNPAFMVKLFLQVFLVGLSLQMRWLASKTNVTNTTFSTAFQ